jgi:hypothetical protein
MPLNFSLDTQPFWVIILVRVGGAALILLVDAGWRDWLNAPYAPS